MKKVDLYLKKNKRMSLLFLLIGLGGVITGIIGMPDMRFKVLIGMGITFLAVGICNFLIYTVFGRKEAIQKTLIAENDELAKKMQHMAAAKTYWIVFIVVALSCALEGFLNISLRMYIVCLLGFMAVTWFGCTIYYTKKLF